MSNFKNKASARTKNSRIGGSAIIFAIVLLGIFSSQDKADNPGIENFDIPQKIKKENFQELESPQFTELEAAEETKAAHEIVANLAPATPKALAAKMAPKQVSSAAKYGQLKAELKGTNGKVLWSTLFQRHIENFEIQRSIDDHSYETIGKVKGAGQGAHEREEVYEFLDKSLANVQMPRVYYRIKQIGFDGLEEVSEPMEYEFGLDLGLYSRIDKKEGGEVKLLYAADRSGPINMRILNVAGEVMSSQGLEADFDPQSLIVDASSWKSGKYFLQLQDESSSVMEQFIYEK
ncbi:MAG: hypothetical protein AAF696_01495 [Bacteroidota bacterium]